jgi:hypothetical protein
MGKPYLDVAPPQCASSRITPHQQLFGKTSHPPYSPDLAPVYFFLFSKLETILKRGHFQTIEKIQ